MINPDAKLSDKVFADDIEKKPTRDGFGKGTVEAGKANSNVVVLSADLGDSTRAAWFQKEFPDRYIEVGVAEQNLATVAAGLAAVGKIPFIASYAAFSPGRSYEQIRTTAALNQQPVKIGGMHAGIQTGPDGATHQMLEDIGLMRMLPHMTVMVPADSVEGQKCVVEAAKLPNPCYIRFGRAAEPVFTTPETPFQIGKALTLWKSEKPTVAFFTTGSVAYRTLQAAKLLEEGGVGSIVLTFHAVKPFDDAAAVEAAKQVSRIVTVEEHQVAGGFGSAVAECLSLKHPIQITRMGMQDEFGQSGEPDELMDFYGLSPRHIADEGKKVS